MIEEKEKGQPIPQWNTPLWEKTDNVIGVKPTFDVICSVCFASRGIRTNMVMRRSRIHTVTDIRMHYGIKEFRPYAFDVAYKCPDCGWYMVFGVAVDATYALHIRELRGGKSDYVLPLEYWDDDERVAKQLEALGYFGGGGSW